MNGSSIAALARMGGDRVRVQSMTSNEATCTPNPFLYSQSSYQSAVSLLFLSELSLTTSPDCHIPSLLLPFFLVRIVLLRFDLSCICDVSRCELVELVRQGEGCCQFRC